MDTKLAAGKGFKRLIMLKRRMVRSFKKEKCSDRLKERRNDESPNEYVVRISLKWSEKVHTCFCFRSKGGSRRFSNPWRGAKIRAAVESGQAGEYVF